jgi:hypothetical protein
MRVRGGAGDLFSDGTEKVEVGGQGQKVDIERM